MNPLDLTVVLVVAGLYTVGFLLVLDRSLMRVVLGFAVLGHGSNLLLLVVGGRPGAAPVLGTVAPGEMADPLPQAMALTAIVITFGLTTFLLALAYRSWTFTGHDTVRDDVEDRRLGSVADRRAREERE
ncbi:Na(+)/H(+) antiporter subunit C [Streptoalloteichus hindustanus]|uniref:Multisubunit sodium/proton antiporter, MrpC subunit n=1 Tax=Streptoalloteichus hindustanus TaxID=2017 RepID=A0A1M5P6S7_STRHI|nr:Na(+)/H(+) antiporter subunit C [Streptoalloteichus hindustanus]SHG97458.1 multisubunit sodium/proton antiporter, MrpC subunit [Streptoalloteichus hindustanus]